MLVQMSAAVDFNDNLAFCGCYCLNGTIGYGIFRVIHYQLGWQLVHRLLHLVLLISTDSCR